MAAQYTVQELREFICATIKTVDNAKQYLLSEDNHREVSTPDEWLDNMKKDGKWCDDIFIYLAATYLKKNSSFCLLMQRMVMEALIELLYHQKK